MHNRRRIQYQPDIRRLTIRVETQSESELADYESMRRDIMRALPFLEHVDIVVDVRDEKRVQEVREQSRQADPPAGGGYKRRARKTQLVLDGAVIVGGEIRTEPTELADMKPGGSYAFRAELTDLSSRSLKNGSGLVTLSLASQTAGVNAKLFLREFEDARQLEKKLRIGSALIAEGRFQLDDYTGENIVEIAKLCFDASGAIRSDTSDRKRIELHAHTKMSELDGLMSAAQLVERIASWGHEAVAITDHGSIQSFIEARDAGKKHGVKILYGIEAYLVDDVDPLIDERLSAASLDGSFVVFDIETTGFSAVNDEIIEFGCVKISGGAVVDEFSTLVKPSEPVSEMTIELTGIDNAMLADAPDIDAAFARFSEFVGDLPLIAHNADFDTSFLRILYPRFGREFRTPYINTIALIRQLLSIRKYNLTAVSRHLGITQSDRHRALADAMATAQVTIKLFQMLKDNGCADFGDVNRYFSEQGIPANMEEHHAIVLVREQEALVDFYTDISHSYIENFQQRPKMRKSDLAKHRSGYLIGSSGEHGELFQAALMRKSDDELDRIAAFYDYIELLPASALANLVASGWVKTLDQIRDINRRLAEAAARCGKPVVATSDAHFLDPEDELLRNMLIQSKGFDRLENEAPMYLRTTDEMLEEFRYLGAELAEQIVVENPHRIADRIGKVSPILEGTFPTQMEGADEELQRLCYARARELYGDVLPPIVEARISRELRSIIQNGYAPMYMISKKMVEQSNRDGYTVGSRGSVGSSIAAFLSGISEVNPLPPHYHCPNCRHSEFFEGSELCGVDLENRDCPLCGTPYQKDGFEIPFEAFLGFEGDKEPDIDLNFASVYQSTAQKYCEELFGEGHTFKAGTIGTLAEKNSLGYVLKYFESIEKPIHMAHALRYRNRLMGIKKNAGQHPAGILVLPQGMDINQFTPIQYAQNDKSTGIVTTHFDYPMLSGKLLKLDVLGHESPTALRMLYDLSGVDHRGIPLDDPETMRIFSSVEPLGYKLGKPLEKVGTLGIPEFGTRFVIGMLEETMPKNFTDLVRISGLSHGTDVWRNNSQELVTSGKVPFGEVIATREDIMNKLINKNCDKLTAFKIMESVRKGKGLTDEWLEEMNRLEMPEWYIDSCLKIAYLFPKAHAAAYVTQSFKIAYYKVHYPLAFYATWYSLHVADFDAPTIIAGRGAVEAKLRQIQSNPESSKKDADIFYNLQIAYEMFCRGIEVLPIDVETSHATEFRIAEGRLLPPIQSLPGVGENAARAIQKAREEFGEFRSIEEFKDKTGCNKKVIEALKELGALNHLPETNQLSFF